MRGVFRPVGCESEGTPVSRTGGHQAAEKKDNLPHKTVVELLFWNRAWFGDGGAADFGWTRASGRFCNHEATVLISAHEEK